MAGKVALRRTKIIATLGPATDDDAVLRRMIENGLDVARLNFSHGSGEILEQRSQQVARLAAEVGRTVAILGDLQGPKIRIGSFVDGKVTLAEGAPFLLDPDMDEQAGTAEGVSIAYKTLADDVEPGDTLLLDDGQIALTVASIDGNRVSTTVLTGGALSNKKGINLKGGGLSAPALTRKDEADIQTAADLNFDYLAVSFVRSATDIRQARALFESAGGHGRIVAKIERTEAVDNIESIIEASDAIMVARGDLGVEMGYAGLTGLQKRIIRSTRYGNKIAITATQMMESMIASPLPTRAEVSDVANAVMDGTDAVMLSAETAVGKHPATVIEAMAEVCLGAEKYQTHRYRASHRMDDTFQHVDEAIAMATMYTANHLDVRAIIALTESGTTTQWMSRIRSDIPIFAFTRNERTSRRVTLYRGVYPVAFDITQTNSVRVYNDVCALLFELGLVDPGDRVIFTKGDLSGVAGGTNAMKIISVPDAEIMQAARAAD
ncbi:MAG: pyruvate kinase [Pseudomonadota bacterium]